MKPAGGEGAVAAIEPHGESRQRRDCSLLQGDLQSCEYIGLITFLKSVFMALMKRRLSKMFPFVIATEGLPFFCCLISGAYR
jgi:hypothetical protein